MLSWDKTFLSIRMSISVFNYNIIYTIYLHTSKQFDKLLITDRLFLFDHYPD